MIKYAFFLTLGSMLLTLAACSGKSNNDAENDDADSAAVATIDSLDTRQLIGWKAMQGMPIYPEEIDTIIAYFAEADRWTGEKLAGVTTAEQFDSVETQYVQQFPYIEVFSMVLEQYASQITDEQMEQLQATALSLGEKVDRAAKAAGLDPEEAKAAALMQSDFTE